MHIQTCLLIFEKIYIFNYNNCQVGEKCNKKYFGLLRNNMIVLSKGNVAFH